MEIIDPHLHLFDLDKGEYAWLQPQNPPFWPDKSVIARNFSEQDLALNQSIELAGFVHIEAGFNNQTPCREIDWLEANCSLPFKTVAFADLTSTHFVEDIQELTKRTSVTGIRHILDEQAEKILSAQSISKRFALLAEKELNFDCQMPVVNTHAVNLLIKHAKQYPNLKIIINHAGWPPGINNQEQYKPWLKNMVNLAECPNIAIKLSAWEMLDRQWKASWLKQVLIDCIQTFGDSRVMFASNFPLCLLTKSYADLWQNYMELVDAISADYWQNITFSNAANWYKLEVVS